MYTDVRRSWFTLPVTFSETACTVGVEEFLAAAKEQGVVEKLDNTTSLTIFAPLKVHKGLKVLDYVVADTVDYSPYLAERTYTAISGAKIVITKDKDGSFLVNGGKLVQEDAIVTNGVMHTFEIVSAPARECVEPVTDPIRRSPTRATRATRATTRSSATTTRRLPSTRPRLFTRLPPTTSPPLPTTSPPLPPTRLPTTSPPLPTRLPTTSPQLPTRPPRTTRPHSSPLSTHLAVP